MVHFIHRNLAYLILILILVWYIRSRKIQNTLLSKTNWLPLTIVLLQTILGILTVINSTHPKALLWLGVAHQFVAMILLLSLVIEFYLIHNREKLIAAR